MEDSFGAKAQVECTVEDWELVLEASLDLNLDDDKATNDLWKRVKEDCMKERAAERRWKHEEKEQRLWVEAEQKVQEEAEWLVRQEAEQKKKEEEKAWRAEEAKWRVEEAEKAAELQRTVERQHKPSVVIPVEHQWSIFRGQGSLQQMHESEAPTQVWSKAAGGPTCKQRRTQTQGDDGEDDDNEGDEMEGDGDFVCPAERIQGLLQAHQVRGLKALQKEMKKANALKTKELKATTKGKEKTAEVSEESSESGDEEEEIEDGCKGGVTKGEGNCHIHAKLWLLSHPKPGYSAHPDILPPFHVILPPLSVFRPLFWFVYTYDFINDRLRYHPLVHSIQLCKIKNIALQDTPSLKILYQW
ncbi:hypothetical protein ID866_10405 [Astraeus odoratus]|nr:hypothetical protein ID866_10405 [Astraeus odoratus]